MSTLPAKQQNGTPPAVRTIQDLLERSKPAIQAALPKHCDPDRMARIALTTIRQSRDLLNCDPLSLVKCVMQASALGLDVDPLLGRAYLVPFGTECTLIVGYKGFIDLARRSGDIQSLEAHAVYEKDEWDYSYGLKPVLYHKPCDEEDRGKLVAAWALARFKDGGHQFEVMNRAQVLKVRSASRGSGSSSSPWVKYEEAMWRKSPIRQLAKFLPLSPEAQRQIAYEEAVEAGVAVHDGECIDFAGESQETSGEEPTEPTRTKAEALAAKLGAKPKPTTEPPQSLLPDEPGANG